MQDGEQLTLDIDNAIDGESPTEAEEATGKVEETENPESATESNEEYVDFEEPSADDDIHDDF